MKVTEIKFMRRYTTDVQYEFEEFTITATPNDGESREQVLEILKRTVEAAHEGNVPPLDEKPPKKGKKPKPEPEEEETEETEESESENDSADEEESESETNDETESEESEEEPPKKPAKSGKTLPGSGTGKKFKKKPQVYQRSNEAHKEIFSKVLASVAPDWKKSFESKAKAKKVSVKMEGSDFLDESGTVLQSFKDSLKKSMAGKK